jgi:DNA-binding SARP family transcriptional activator
MPEPARDPEPSPPPAGAICFRLLGPLEVEVDGAPLALGGHKQRALLALLLIHARKVVPTDRLVDELWGEHPPRTATTSLQNFVSQLRKALPGDVLLTTPPGYMIRASAEAIDAARFERLVADARGEGAKRRAALLREALALWRGPPLADFVLDTFAQGEIRRLEELRRQVVEERIEADLELGGGAELVAELEGLVAEHPLRERLRGQLMLALYRAGRQAEALQAYHDARRVLADELGIDPSPVLSQLYRSILRQEGTLERAPAPRRVDDHVGDVARALLGGRLVTVLGAQANEPDGACDGALPRPAEVAAHLTRIFDCPPAHARDLAHIAEYVAVVKGAGPLYDELHALFDRDCAPGPVHRAVAELATLLRARGAPRQLLLTTTFDELLEQAFREAGEELDVVLYLALGRHRGKFLHLDTGGRGTVVEVPNAYTDLSLDRTTVLFKIHGGIDRRPEREWESFVVSEDDYIDYLAQADISVAVPVTLAARLRRSHFLFLGCPLQDWSLRVFLHRLFGREKVGYRSWAIGTAPDEIEQELWRQRGIDIFDVPLDEYVARLRSRVEAESRP